MKRELSSYPQIVLDAWAVHEAFNCLGFRGRELFYTTGGNAAAPESGPWVFVTLRSQEREFVATVGPLNGLDPKETEGEWTDFVRRFLAGEFSHEKLKWIYKRRFLDRAPGPASLVLALKAKGFELRPHPRDTN